MKALLLLPFIFVSSPSKAETPKEIVPPRTSVSIQKKESSLSLCRLEVDGQEAKGHIYKEEKPAKKKTYDRDEFIGNRVQASNFPRKYIHKSISNSGIPLQPLFQSSIARIIDVRYKGKLYFIDSKNSPLARHIFKYKLA